MKIAVLSDIHGNIHALRAVLDDAQNAGATGFILLGDYYLDMPFPNEVAQTLKQLPILAMVRGNKEDYLRHSAWDKNNLQMSSLIWNLAALSPSNHNFFAMLPEEISFNVNGINIWAFHAYGRLFAHTAVMNFGSGRFYQRMHKEPFNHSQYLDYVDSLLSADEKLGAMPGGVYLFGHSHIQWHWQRGDKLLLNPGSCGMPLDFQTTAAYSLIEYNSGRWQICERRVPYDVALCIRALRESDLYKAAPDFSEVITEQLQSAMERVSFLISLAENFAIEAGEDGKAQPFSNEVWIKACRKYRTGIPKL